MTLTRRDIIEKLKDVSYEINMLVRQLEAQPAAGPQGDANLCPIHNVPYIKTAYGWGHKLNDGTGKWCNKVVRKNGKG